MTDRTLLLRIKALVEGASDLKSLKDDVRGLVTETKSPSADPTKPLREGAKATRPELAALKAELASLVGAFAVFGFAKNVIDETNKAQAAFKGLEAVANSTGAGIQRAFAEATKISADGLVTVSQASQALQNLLSRGYSLDEAIGTLTRLKDAAAFNRQAHLSMGEAVVSATEGLKNENSILVDNAGVTKNVSVMWKEYAERVGTTVDKLTQSQKIQAEVAGIQRETAAQTGNAAKMADTAAGSVAKLSKAWLDLKITLGDSVLPVLDGVAKGLKYLIENVVAPGAKVITSFGIAVAGAFGPIFETFRSGGATMKLDYAGQLKAMKDALDEVWNKPQTLGVFKPQEQAFGSTRPGSIDLAKPKADAKKSAQDTSAAYLALARAQADAEFALLKSNLQAAQKEYDIALQQNLVSLKGYYDAKTLIATKQIDAEIAGKRKELDAVRKLETEKGASEVQRVNARATAVRLESEIAVLEQERSRAGRENAVAQAEAERKLGDALANVRTQLAALTNGGASGEQVAENLRAQFRELRAQLDAMGNAEGVNLLDKYIDVSAKLADLSRLEGQFSRVMQTMALQEESVALKVRAGTISENEANRERAALYLQIQDNVRGLIPVMQQLAAASGSDEAVQRVEALKVKVEELGVKAVEVSRKFETGFGSALGSFATSIITDFKRAGDAAENFGKRVIGVLIDIQAQEFAKGATRWLSEMFPTKGHAGGIVGSLTHRGAGVSPLLFVGAPRFHSGGLVGGERPIIAKDGEEILTEDDPRHRRNFRGGVQVNVYEAPGTKATVRGNDSGGVDVMIEMLDQGMARLVRLGTSATGQALADTVGGNRAFGAVR